ncbi:uncharacterized protein [Engystomops pustulosus]|uniref:uncharacterized protein isoform X2 n=1 Tax=Engystomops pustulosus TaxID=76066 RepID=UPI003AFAC48A
MGSVTFEDVAVQFSEDEWRRLQTQEKDLYREVMTDNYHNLTSLGLTVSPPEIVVKIERGEEPCVDTEGDRMAGGGGSEEVVPGVSAARGVITRRSLRLVKRNSGQWIEERRRASARTSPQDLSRRETPGEAQESEEKRHTCGQCGESWSRLIDFLSHQMGSCQDRPHRCNVCSKTFAKKQHLNAHRRTHTEDRPYTCNQCGRSFRQNSTLTTHLWSHAGHKPFHCTCCTKSFSRKTDLVAHMRRHTGERPYECPYCWDRFIRKKSLQRHLQKHSGESLQAGWERDYPRWKQDQGCGERDPKTEEMNVSTREMRLRWDAERRTEPPYVERPPLPPPPPLKEIVHLAEPIKTEEEQEKQKPETVSKVEQSSQTENKRPSRLQQEMLRELKRFRRSAAQAQRERDLMRSAMDQMAQEMKEMKEMVASLCASGAFHPAGNASAILVQNSCAMWSRHSEDRHSTESSRASPESSLQCGYPLSRQGREPVSWMYESAPQEEDDMLPTTTIKREEEEEEEELSMSPEAEYYHLHQYPNSYRIGERLPNIPLQPLSSEKEWSLLARCAGKPGRFAALVFRALVPFDIYKNWVNRVNLDGLRGRQGIPLNVKRRVMAVVERHFSLRKCDHSEIRNRLNEQLRTRRKSDKHPQPGLPETQLLSR